MFVKGSRYETTPEAIHVDASGREIAYKKLRLLPKPPGFQVHAVAREDRLDRIAFLYYADPEQFWRICDGNAALRPTDLEEVGRRLQVPLPLR
jgi:hypothetical protein